MNKIFLLIATAAITAGSAAQAADVGVSIGISQPGVYGRIDIGRFPQPELIVAAPVVVRPPRVVVAQPVQPVYLWVPPGHQKHWSKHCGRYNACGVPVYFVKDQWYRGHVMPPPKPARGHDHGHDDKGHGHGHDRD